MWAHTHTLVIEAAPERLWAILADVPRWPEWNAGIEAIRLHGRFEQGTTFSMTLPGQESLTSTLIAVEPGVGFTDETWVGEVRVVVSHALRALHEGRTEVVYGTEVTGPDAEEVGRMVTADFPDVLAALKRRAEGS